MTAVEAGAPKLVAYVINPAMELPLCPAPRARAWMEATDQRFANRCLPLLIANQAGWFLVSAHTLRVVWNGGSGLDDVKVHHSHGRPPYPAISHFGHGIVTWNVPYLFRTPPGYNLLVRGPSNWPKDGATPLEGIVETDWAAATFTVNWRLTRPGHAVTFEVGEPVCMLVPQPRGELEAFEPEIRMLEMEPALARQYHSWSASRAEFNAALATPGSDARKQRWQKHYFQGIAPDAAAAAAAPADRPAAGQHHTRLALKPFVDRRGDGAGPGQRPPDAEAVLRGLIVEENFIDPAACRALVGFHRRFGTMGKDSDNGCALVSAREGDPEVFELVRGLIRRLAAFIDERFGAKVECDLSIVCALVRGGFRHTLHADNALVFCPRHGSDAEELRRVRCQCPDAEVRPNHTPWRTHSALLYLSGDHRGGDIVFGEGPHAFGGTYRRQIHVRPGMLVLSPSNELYFHHTTPVESGVRYSMNTWFTDDGAHVAPEWR
jgi:hypothetical protein